MWDNFRLDVWIFGSIATFLVTWLWESHHLQILFTPALGPSQPHVQWLHGTLSSGVQEQDFEAERSPASNASWRMRGAVLALRRMPLHKQKVSLYFYLYGSSYGSFVSPYEWVLEAALSGVYQPRLLTAHLLTAHLFIVPSLMRGMSALRHHVPTWCVQRLLYNFVTLLI
jgi:hypothetical protein